MKQHSNTATTLVMQSVESKILAGVSKCQCKECQWGTINVCDVSGQKRV